MQAASTDQQEARSEEDQAKFRSRRMNTITLINFSFFVGYLLDQFVFPVGITGIILATGFAAFMAVRLYSAESATPSM